MKKFIRLTIIISTLGLFIPTATMFSTAYAADEMSQSTTKNESIKFRLAEKINDAFPGNHFDVTVFNSQILLTGQAADANIKSGAEKIAKDNAEGQQVVNYIDVSKPQPVSRTTKDDLITSKLSAKLLTISGIDTKKVKIVTTNASIYIMGEADATQESAIMSNAKAVNGIKKIVNILTITP